MIPTVEELVIGEAKRENKARRLFLLAAGEEEGIAPRRLLLEEEAQRALGRRWRR